LNLKTTVDALPYFIKEKNVALFTKHKVFSKTEVHSRYEILLENYCKTLNIEALTMLEMVKKEIIPAVCAYMKDLSKTALSKKALLGDANCTLEESMVSKLSGLSACLYNKAEGLENELLGLKDCSGIKAQADYYKNTVIPSMQELRAIADELEVLVGEKYWPFPTYGDLLFKV
jgi:glutamine synthetase